ncbi:MAG: hypothetical protein H5T99_06575 [Moorella sp. (in: Bacteria)]|nr:hypothetical protein [Moorella sp. (in: firmicutes)]
MVARAFARYGGTVEGKKKAASALGISLATLYHYLHSIPGLPSRAPYRRFRAKERANSGL